MELKSVGAQASNLGELSYPIIQNNGYKAYHAAPHDGLIVISPYQERALIRNKGYDERFTNTKCMLEVRDSRGNVEGKVLFFGQTKRIFDNEVDVTAELINNVRHEVKFHLNIDNQIAEQYKTFSLYEYCKLLVRDPSFEEDIVRRSTPQGKLYTYEHPGMPIIIGVSNQLKAAVLVVSIKQNNFTLAVTTPDLGEKLYTFSNDGIIEHTDFSLYVWRGHFGQVKLEFSKCSHPSCLMDAGVWMSQALRNKN